MRERRLRWSLPLILCLVLALAWSCNLPSSGPSSSQAGSSSEAEKTRKIEEKAAEIDRHAEELRNMQGSEQEKIDAMNRLDQERKELNEMQEQGSK